MKIPEFFRDQYLPDISLLGMTVVWGLSFTVLKIVLGDEISPILLVLGRFSLAVVVIFPFCRKKVFNQDRRSLMGGVLLGALLFAGFIAQSVGIGLTTASRSAFITGLSAVFVPLFLFVHRGVLPRPVYMSAILAAIAGMYLLTGPAGGGFNRGDFLTLLCAVAFGGQIYVMGVVAPGRDFMSLTFVELLTTALLAVVFLPLESIRFEISFGSVAAVAFLGLAATVGALLVQTWAQRKTSAVKAGLIFTAEPVFAYLFASMFLGEYFNSAQKFGGAIIMMAVLAAEVLPAIIGRGKTR